MKSSELLSACTSQLLKVCGGNVTTGYGTGSDNAKYGGVDANGKAYDYGYPCHAYMSSLLMNHAVVVYSQFRHPAKTHKLDHALEMFHAWLTGKGSPWEPVLQGLSEDNPSRDPEYSFKYGFVFDNLDTVPSNYLHNFLVATRMPKEWPMFIRLWSEFIEAGIDPAVAMFFSTVFQNRKYNNKGQLEESGDWFMSVTNTYDWPLDHATCGQDYVTNLMTGKVDKKVLNPPFMKATGYTPVNRIWGNNALTMGASGTYLRQLFDTYHTTIGYPEEKARSLAQNIGPFDHFKSWFMSLEDVKHIVHLESERLVGELKAA